MLEDKSIDRVIGKREPEIWLTLLKSWGSGGSEVLGTGFLGGRLIHSLERGDVKVYFFPRKDSREGMSFGEIIGRVKLKSGSEIFEGDGSCCLIKK